MTLRIATLLEVMLVTAVCLALLRYALPLGLILISTYASVRLVLRAFKIGETRTARLARTGALWGIAATMTLGLAAVVIIIGRRLLFAEPLPNTGIPWAIAIVAGIVIVYGSLAAVVGALVGTCSGVYIHRHVPRHANKTSDNEAVNRSGRKDRYRLFRSGAAAPVNRPVRSATIRDPTEREVQRCVCY